MENDNNEEKMNTLLNLVSIRGPSDSPSPQSYFSLNQTLPVSPYEKPNMYIPSIVSANQVNNQTSYDITFPPIPDYYTTRLPMTPLIPFSISSPYTSPTMMSSHPLEAPARWISSGTNSPCQNCLVCQLGCPRVAREQPTWSVIMRVVFFTLDQKYPGEYFNLKKEIYLWMSDHWNIICGTWKPFHPNWKKQIQDMLSHSKNLFQSGSNELQQNGYWRTKPENLIDPWTMPRTQREKSKIITQRDEVSRKVKMLGSDRRRIRRGNNLDREPRLRSWEGILRELTDYTDTMNQDLLNLRLLIDKFAKGKPGSKK